jgi:hypothetical protein
MTYISSIKMVCILEPASNATATDQNFSVVGRFIVTQVLEIWILGTPNHRKCKVFC